MYTVLVALLIAVFSKTIITDEASDGLGFCPDLEPDYGVGVAIVDLLVGSADVEYDSICRASYSECGSCSPKCTVHVMEKVLFNPTSSKL